MQTLILSDLHNDHWKDDPRDVFDITNDLLTGIEAIVLAGDISNKPKVRWKAAFARLRDRFGDIPIHVFPGNHDFYDYQIDNEERLAEFARAFDVTYAQMTAPVIGNTRLICATLWTDFELNVGRTKNEIFIPTRMNDYRYIRRIGGGYSKLRAKDVIALHRSHLAYIEHNLAIAHDGPTFVVTHHAPHPAVLEDYKEPIHAAYASDLSALMTGSNAPDTWIFGHCHGAKSMTVGSTKLRCVSLGYPSELKSDDEIRNRIAASIFDL